MSNTIIDNSNDFKLVKYLREYLANKSCDYVRIATGYWDLPGMKLILPELKKFFERGGRLDLLIGQEPMLRSYQIRTNLTPEEKFPDFYIQRDINTLTDDYKPIAQLLLDYASENEEDSQIRIHVYGQGEDKRFLHAKCYIFTGTKFAEGIIGSSNFTERGLEDNHELNYLEAQYAMVTYPDLSGGYKSHLYWFNEMWEQSEPWTGHFLKEILLKSPLGKELLTQNTIDTPDELTPYEVYIKYLQIQFGDMIDTNTSTLLKTYLPQDFNSLEYQLDAVKQCFSIMKRYGGFMLGDVVGLGKTVVGLLLIRYFIENATTLGRSPKILIITPPAIKNGWVKTIRDFDKNNKNQIEQYVTFVTTGSVAGVLETFDEVTNEDGDELEDIKMDNYGLILIDESHGFRNTGTQKYQAVNDLIGFINPTPFVGLITATPQNNSPKDIYNQIRLFQRNPNNSTLPGIEGGKLDTFFNRIEKRYREARNMPQDTTEQRAEAHQIIAEVSEQVRKCVLNELVVRRTRSDIKKLYGEDASLLKFPKVKGPHKLEYHMDDELQKLFFDTTMAICPPDDGEPFDPNKHIGFFRYAAITQFKEKANTKLYEKRNLTVAGITARLQRIMRILLVKRLESSIAAFKTTLGNLNRYNDVMIDMIENECIYICPDIDINKIHQESDGDFEKFQKVVEEKIQKKGGNNRRFTRADFNDDYISTLKSDRKLISKLLNRWRANDFDPKFDRFKEAVTKELFDKTINNPSGKNKPRLVIFTEAIDTVQSISRYLKSKDFKVLEITSKNRDELQDLIESNFDANCPREKQCDDYNVIVTTEVLAEGVNLHRANVILNYDAPWNSTRLMQRIGRINRIGSVEDYVHVFNFFPSEEGNSQIRLIEKAYAKLQSFHEMFGEDNKVFSEREELCEHDLQKLIDGSESPFGPYIKELKAYRDNYPQRYFYIANLEANPLGGIISVPENKNAIFVFTDNTQSYMTVSVNMLDNKAEVISSLVTMEQLKCDPSLRYVSNNLEAYNDLLEIARRKYHSHSVNIITQQDSSKNIKRALEVIKKLRENPKLTTDTKKLLRDVSELVRSKDSFVIKQILRFDPENPSLFGFENDINDLLNAAFAHVADRAQAKRGESKIAIYSINKIDQ